METRTKFMHSKESKEVGIALESSITKLTIEQFINVVGFEIDEIMFNEFWQIVAKEKAGTHVGARLLEWLGYEGNLKNRKQKFVDYLKRNEIAYKEISFDDECVSNYASIQEEISGANMGNVKRAKFLVINSDDFKMAIMGLSTKRGNAIRRYYLRVEKLLKLFVEYERRFETRKLEMEKTSMQDKMDEMMRTIREIKVQNVEQAQKMDRQTRKMDKLLLQNIKLKSQNDQQLDDIRALNDNLEVVQDKLEIAVEDRAPRTTAIHKRERFVLFKKNYPDEYYGYYVIRGQQGYCRNKLTAFDREFPNMEILIDIECQPNPISLFNHFKERNARREQQQRFEVSGNDIALGVHTESTLVELFYALHEERKRIERFEN